MLKEDEENIRKLKEKKLKNDRVKTRTKELMEQIHHNTQPRM